MRKGTYSYMHDNFVRAWSHCAVCAFVVSSQAENSVGFCKPMRAVTDRIMLLTNVWNGLLRRQKLFGRVSWCLYPLFLPSLPSPPMDEFPIHLDKNQNPRDVKPKDAASVPSVDVQKTNILSYFLGFSNLPLPLKNAYPTDYLIS